MRAKQSWMAEQFANVRKNIKPRLWFENLEPQMAEQFANERKNVKPQMCFEAIIEGGWGDAARTCQNCQESIKIWQRRPH